MVISSRRWRWPNSRSPSSSNSGSLRAASTGGPWATSSTTGAAAPRPPPCASAWSEPLARAGRRPSRPRPLHGRGRAGERGPIRGEPVAGGGGAEPRPAHPEPHRIWRQRSTPAPSPSSRSIRAGRRRCSSRRWSKAWSVGNRWIVAFARTELTSLAARRGDLDTALELAGLVIDTWHRAGDWANQWLTLRHVAGVFAQRGEHEEAAVLRGALRVAAVDLAMPIEASDLRRLAAILERLPDALGVDRLADLEAQGAAMSGDSIVRRTQQLITQLLPPG